MTGLLPLAASLASALLLGASPAPPRFERAIEEAGPGRAAVTLDRHVYEGARADLGDLRIVDGSGAGVAYVLERADTVTPSRRSAAIRNRGFVPGKEATATLDFGGLAPKSEVVVVTSGDSFRRRVTVEGSADGQRWVTLTDGAYVFAVPGAEAARFERVALPENDYRLLRVTVAHGTDDPDRIAVREAWIPAVPRRLVREETLTPVLQRSEDEERGETVLGLELGARHQPFVGLAFEVDGARFFRTVVVEARRDSPPPRRGASPEPIRWERLAEGVLYRYAEGEGAREALRLDVFGRERALRVRIRNRDDRALAVGQVAVLVPVERVVFEAEAGKSYRMTYGSPDLPPPDYDLMRTVADPSAWAAAAASARLGPPVSRPAPAQTLPWTERHPALLWAGLVAVVAALGALTWRALRSAEAR